MKITFHRKVILFSLLLCSTGCFSRWSDEERRAFETECSTTRTFENQLFFFIGFENNEFDSIWIKEYQKEIVLDSFQVFVPPATSSFDKELKKRSVIIERKMNTNFSYKFLIPGYKDFEFSKMKMIMWQQNTMTSEGWGCCMGEYAIDGVLHKHDRNPTFEKK